ncbi:uncharacterized protein LOC134737666 isoform X3 [Pongo pygmaeus]|uniref:uncharacterized protein LOC134737666 isoform X3 n=1 Tax=Pongo pygmaeus TaxID=9600 RepID=UPI00300C5F36
MERVLWKLWGWSLFVPAVFSSYCVERFGQENLGPRHIGSLLNPLHSTVLPAMLPECSVHFHNQQTMNKSLSTEKLQFM